MVDPLGRVPSITPPGGGVGVGVGLGLGVGSGVAVDELEPPPPQDTIIIGSKNNKTIFIEEFI